MTSYLILMRIQDFPPLMNLPRDRWEPVPFPSPAPSQGPQSLLLSHVRDARGSPREPGREGRSPRSPRERRSTSLPRQPPPPALPRRGPSALPAASRAGMAKFPCRSCLGEPSGHSPPPRKSVACSLPWKLGVERRRKIKAAAPGAVGAVR